MRRATMRTGPLTVAVTVALGILLPTAGGAAAACGDIRLVSVTPDGVAGNGSSGFPSVSAAGDVVAFASVATDLSALDNDRNYDVYVKNLITGGVVLASASSTGAKADVGGEFPASSGSGRYVAFQSQSTNLAAADRNRRSDIYVKDLLSGRVALASANAAGRTGNGSSTQPSLSADGSAVAFVSTSTNLDPADPDPVADVYVKNLRTGQVRIASISSDGHPGNGSSANPSLSGDGLRVAFDSAATDLHPADTDELTDVYVADLQSGLLYLASTSGSGVKGNGASLSPALSGEGSTVAFTSLATDLDPADDDPGADVYVKAVDTGNLRLASRSRLGGSSNGDSTAAALSADGMVVAFQSAATNLDPADRNRLTDVYAADLRSGELRVVSTSDDGELGNAGSGNPALTADGRHAAFDSAATNFDPADGGRFDYDSYLKLLCASTA